MTETLAVSREEFVSLLVLGTAFARAFLFFFSSRRRHTRYWRDWSSDVCSSDLALRVGFVWKNTFCRKSQEATTHDQGKPLGLRYSDFFRSLNHSAFGLSTDV